MSNDMFFWFIKINIIEVKEYMMYYNGGQWHKVVESGDCYANGGVSS